LRLLGRHGGARRVLARFRSDRRGATAVQAILLMPIVLFFFVAAVVLWQTVNVRKSLHDGTYRAMRYLSLYPPARIDAFVWEDIARDIIEAELLSNPWVQRPITDAGLRVTVTIFDSNECGDEFTLEAGYRLFAPVGRVDSSTSIGIMPNNVQIELRENVAGMVICD
jgi:Flp pilus assembly protein TadG